MLDLDLSDLSGDEPVELSPVFAPPSAPKKKAPARRSSTGSTGGSAARTKVVQERTRRQQPSPYLALSEDEGPGLSAGPDEYGNSDEDDDDEADIGMALTRQVQEILKQQQAALEKDAGKRKRKLRAEVESLAEKLVATYEDEMQASEARVVESAKKLMKVTVSDPRAKEAARLKAEWLRSQRELQARTDRLCRRVAGETDAMKSELARAVTASRTVRKEFKTYAEAVLDKLEKEVADSETKPSPILAKALKPVFAAMKAASEELRRAARQQG